MVRGPSLSSRFVGLSSSNGEDAPLSLASLSGYPASSFERDQQTWLATDGLLDSTDGWPAALGRQTGRAHAALRTAMLSCLPSPCLHQHALPAHHSHLLPWVSPPMAVGGTVHVEVERGGQPLAADIRVQDLHAVTPKKLLDLGGGAVNELSYQQASGGGDTAQPAAMSTYTHTGATLLLRTPCPALLGKCRRATTVRRWGRPTSRSLVSVTPHFHGAQWKI